MTQSGTLYIIGTPIGNLKDMSTRAIETLRSVHLIVAEDTRHSLPLLKHFSINIPLLSLHDHNETQRTAPLLKRLQQGESIALISDAGTPLISDPGYSLVHEVKKCNVRVVPIPGPCAAITALCAGGLPTDRFIFEGFLPKKLSLRKSRLMALQAEERTMVFYESPHRLENFLKEALAIFGRERLAVIARELTKLYETIKQDTLSVLANWIMQEKNNKRGEFVILIAGKKHEKIPEETAYNHLEQILKILLETLPLKQSVIIATKITGFKKNVVYNAALKYQK